MKYILEEALVHYSDKKKLDYDYTVESIYTEYSTLEELRKNIPAFTPPQSYLLLENHPILTNYIKEREKFSKWEPFPFLFILYLIYKLFRKVQIWR